MNRLSDVYQKNWDAWTDSYFSWSIMILIIGFWGEIESCIFKSLNVLIDEKTGNAILISVFLSCIISLIFVIIMASINQRKMREWLLIEQNLFPNKERKDNDR